MGAIGAHGRWGQWVGLKGWSITTRGDEYDVVSDGKSSISKGIDVEKGGGGGG